MTGVRDRLDAIQKLNAAVEWVDEAYEVWPTQSIRLAREELEARIEELDALHDTANRKENAQ